LIGKQVKLGKVGLNAEVLPSTISGNFSVADNADSLLHQIGIEAVRGERPYNFKIKQIQLDY
jgi:hypothetical protein